MRGEFQVSTCANSVPRPQFRARTCTGERCVSIIINSSFFFLRGGRQAGRQAGPLRPFRNGARSSRDTFSRLRALHSPLYSKHDLQVQET